MTRQLFLFIILSGILNSHQAKCQPDLQSGKIIPVYPGSSLKQNLEPGESKMCCTFKTNAPFDKVVSYYENSLKMKSVDPNGLAEQIPALKQQVNIMLGQMPAGMKIRFFILKKVEFQGQQGAETFEVVYTGQEGTEFSIMDSQLSQEDQHFAEEWNGDEITGSDQVKPVSAGNAAQLVAALPTASLAGYEKSELNINADGYSPASAGIDYSKTDVNISVTITDYTGFMEGIGDVYKAQYDNEKSVTVKNKYPGKETLTKVGNNCGGADKIFLVKNRYLVVISTMNMCDFAVINQLIDRMNLEKLQ